MDAQTWAAVAAVFSACSSFLIYLTHRRNSLESTRPELVISGWSRSKRGSGDAEHEVLAFDTVCNVGRGQALHVIVLPSESPADRLPDGSFVALGGGLRLPLLAPGEARSVNGQITLWWKNAVSYPGGKRAFIAIKLMTWDSMGHRHQTTYKLMVVEDYFRHVVGAGDDLAPGVMFLQRTTRSESVRLLKARAHARRFGERVKSNGSLAMSRIRALGHQVDRSADRK